LADAKSRPPKASFYNKIHPFRKEYKWDVQHKVFGSVFGNSLVKHRKKNHQKNPKKSQIINKKSQMNQK
jgi:hypothetical protein